jgi:peptidoglycan hydrolase-like protein with peptidoglycan-binding domain
MAASVLVIGVAPAPALAGSASGSHVKTPTPNKQYSTHVDRASAVVLALGSGYSSRGGAAHVWALQRRLAGAGFAPGPIDGRYGPRTEQAVRSFQAAHGLGVNGIAGAQYLQPGGSPAVRSVQRRLSRAGFSPGPADGRYGPLTAQAVKRFQHAHRLAADGIAGALTLHALGSRHPKGSSPRRHTAPGPRHYAAPRPHRHANPTAPKPQVTPATPKPQTAPAQRAGHGSSWLKWVILAVLIVIAIAVFVLVGPDRRPKRATAEDAKAAPEDGAAPSAAAAVAPIAVAAAAALAASRAAAEPVPAPQAATGEPSPVRETPAPVPADAPPVPDEVPSPSEDPLPALEEAMLAGESAVAVSVEVRAERAERVKALQRQLSWLGLEPGPVDGQYGPVTTEAVKRFQKLRDLPADGVADPRTLRALRAGTPERPFTGRLQRVKEMQSRLAALGFAPGPVDGRYGPATTGAVKRFQEANDLPVHGVADPLTLNALRAHIRGRPFTGRIERVKELQRHLTALGLEPGPVDGRYGPATTEAVKRFQQRHRLPMDGIADPHTLNALRKDIEQIPTLNQTTTPASAITPSPDPGGPDDADGAFTHALLLEEHGDEMGAMAAYQRADGLGHGAAATNLGVLLEQHGDRTAAEASYRRADQRGDANGAFNLAILLEEQGNHIGALRAYQRVEQLGHPEIADMARAAALDLRRQSESPIAVGQGAGHDGP